MVIAILLDHSTKRLQQHLQLHIIIIQLASPFPDIYKPIFLKINISAHNL